MKTASTVPDAVKIQLLLNILLSGKQGFFLLLIPTCKGSLPGKAI